MNLVKEAIDIGIQLRCAEAGEVARISFVLEPCGNWIELSQRRSLTDSLEPA